MQEENFLNIIRETLPESVKYLRDDTAYLSEKDLILTQDTLIEDIHFRTRTISPFYLGRKSIAVNLSDIAAAGGIAQYLLISLSMPKKIAPGFVKEFYKGVKSICNEHKVLVVGGDLTGAEKITISICALGSANGLTPANRRNAKPGEAVIVTGNFASSAAGFYLLEELYKETGEAEKVPEKTRKKLISSHIDPMPRLKEGRKILEAAKNLAMMDTSDGLADALYKICAMSKVGMKIDFAEVPYDPDIEQVFKDEKSVMHNMLFGGEDYELVATVSEEVYKELKKEISIKKIGMVIDGDDNSFAYVKFRDKESFKIDSTALDSGLYSHFEG